MRHFERDRLGEVEDDNKLPTDQIKDCIKRIAGLGDKIGAPLDDIDKKLSDDIVDLSIMMFARKKIATKSFTVLKNDELSALLIDKETGSFTEKDTISLNNFFNNNLDAFSQLVVYSYFKKPVTRHRNDDLIFYASIYSRYSGESHDVFFVKNSGEFYVFDERVTESKLIEYISDYFGHDDKIEKELSELFQNEEIRFTDAQKCITRMFSEFSEQKRTDYNFISGTITFMDFLAWKGLWQTQDGGDTLKNVSELIDGFRNAVNQYSRDLFVNAKDIPLSRLISISDTIAIFTPRVSDVSEADLLELHAKIARYILETSVKGQYPIRGAITYGEYSFLNNVMIGPGIDECASWHETGDWIGVHFTPSAQFILNQNPDGKPDSTIFKPGKIPLKSGTPSIDFCIRWSVSKSEFYNLANKTKALLPEIAGKYLNTYNFLESSCWKEGETNGKE